MAKFKLYEVRIRGEFMLMGYYFYAENHESAAEMGSCIHIGSSPLTDSVIIQAEPGVGNGDWCLISVKGDRYHPDVQIGKEIIHPYDNTTKKRLAFAKACENICQCIDEIPSLEFNDFDKQTKWYEAKDWREDKPPIVTREANKKRGIEIAATSIECIERAEQSIIKKEQKNAKDAMFGADIYLGCARMGSFMSHVQGSTKPNEADLSFAEAHKKYHETNEKFHKFNYQQAIDRTAESIKECAIAETATIAGETTKANTALFHAKELNKKAKLYVFRKSNFKSTEHNRIQKEIAKAEKQLDKTTKKISQLHNKTIPTNQDKGSGIG